MAQTASLDGGADRRRFFRIADTLSLRFRSLSLDECQQWRDGVFSLEPNPDLRSLDAEISSELERLKQYSPELSSIAESLNSKLNVLSKHVAMHLDSGFSENYKTLNVSLSACGVGFPIAEPLEEDSLLLIDMLLTSEHKRVLVTGRVIGSDQLSIPGPHGSRYMARINFEKVDERLSEDLIQYVLQQQRRILAAQRIAQEEKDLVALRP
jgi:hypothetical protein